MLLGMLFSSVLEWGHSRLAEISEQLLIQEDDPGLRLNLPLLLLFFQCKQGLPARLKFLIRLIQLSLLASVLVLHWFVLLLLVLEITLRLSQLVLDRANLLRLLVQLLEQLLSILVQTSLNAQLVVQLLNFCVLLSHTRNVLLGLDFLLQVIQLFFHLLNFGCFSLKLRFHFLVFLLCICVFLSYFLC